MVMEATLAEKTLFRGTFFVGGFPVPYRVRGKLSVRCEVFVGGQSSTTASLHAGGRPQVALSYDHEGGWSWTGNPDDIHVDHSVEESHSGSIGMRCRTP